MDKERPVLMFLLGAFFLIAGIGVFVLVWGLPCLMAWRAWKESGFIMALLSFFGVLLVEIVVVSTVVGTFKTIFGIKG